MKINILADAWWESRVGAVLQWLSSASYWEIFEENIYGEGLACLAIILVCREPSLKFKRRIRYSRKDKTIYMDVMLELSKFMNLTPEERKREVINALLKEVPEIVGKYKIEDFNTERFLLDFNQKFTSILP